LIQIAARKNEETWPATNLSGNGYQSSICVTSLLRSEGDPATFNNALLLSKYVRNLNLPNIPSTKSNSQSLYWLSNCQDIYLLQDLTGMEIVFKTFKLTGYISST